MKCSYLHRRLEIFIKPVLCRIIAPSIMVGNDFVNDNFLAFLSRTTSGQKHAATKYRHFSYLPVLSLENWDIRHKFSFVYAYQPPAPYLWSFQPSERSSVVVEMTDEFIEWYFVFILQKLLFLTRNMFLCQCPSALSITMLSFAGWLSKDIYIAIIVSRYLKPQLDLLCCFSLWAENNLRSVQIDLSDILPPCCLFTVSCSPFLGSHHVCIWVFAGTQLQSAQQTYCWGVFSVLTPVERGGIAIIFQCNFAHITFPTGRPCLTMISDFQPPTFEQIKTASFRLLL